MFRAFNKLNDRDLLSRRNLGLKDNILNISSVMDLGKLDLAYKKGKGVDQKWFVNPYLFVMIALEMDPEIYAEVVIWLTDGLIENRNEAGDAYVRMCSAISKIVPNKNDLKDNIKRVAKAINTRPNYITMAGCPIKRITEQFDFSDWNQDSDFHQQESVA